MAVAKNRLLRAKPSRQMANTASAGTTAPASPDGQAGGAAGEAATPGSRRQPESLAGYPAGELLDQA